MSTTHTKRAEIVPASAGSGKTYRIAHEYVYDVLRDRLDDNGNPYFDRSFYKRILAVTFTNKATEEMKSRILEEIHLLASGKKSDHLKDLISETGLDEATLRSRAKIIRSLILHDYSHFTVLTNDTFFQRILRAFVRELGIDMNFTTELDTAPIFDRSVDALLESASEDEDLRMWLINLLDDVIQNKDKIKSSSSSKTKPNWNIRVALSSLKNELFKESNKDIISRIDKHKLQENVTAFEADIKSKKKYIQSLGEEGAKLIVEQGVNLQKVKDENGNLVWDSDTNDYSLVVIRLYFISEYKKNELADFDVEAVYDGESGAEYAKLGIYDLLILDVMMPGLDGFQVAKALRAERCATPILMLTARGGIDDRIQGLNAGADYYLTKPFDTRELLACVGALLRRQGNQVDELTFGNTSLDLGSGQLLCGEKSVRLSAREFDVMRLLMHSGERILSKEIILARVWGYESNAVENHVEVYVGFLRKKLRSIGSDIRIEAIRRLGYHLEVEKP